MNKLISDLQVKRINIVLMILIIYSCNNSNNKVNEKPIQLLGEFYSFQSIKSLSPLIIENTNRREQNNMTSLEGLSYLHENSSGKLDFLFIDDQLCSVKFTPRRPSNYLEKIKNSMNIDLRNQCIVIKDTLYVQKYFDEFYLCNSHVIWGDIRLIDTLSLKRIPCSEVRSSSTQMPIWPYMD